MIFRTLQPDDAVFYQFARRRALEELPQFVGPLAEREASMEVDELRRQLAAYPAQGVNVFGCFLNGEGAAVAAMTRKLDPKYAHKLFLWGMFVLPSYRRHSIGRCFLSHLVGFAQQQVGVQFITLQVTTTNAPARALYERNSFVSYGIEPCALLLNGAFLDFELMQLDLRAAVRSEPSSAA